MKYALISDLHSSVADTKAVLAHIKKIAPESQIIGLGDIFECTIGKKKAKTVSSLSLQEAALIPAQFPGLLTFPTVRGNQEERIEQVTGQPLFHGWPSRMKIEGATLMHGHQWKWTKEWQPVPPKTEPPLLFFGHSHEAGLYRKNKKLPFTYGEPILLKKKRYGINVGAVWLTREWVLYNSAERTVTFMRAS